MAKIQAMCEIDLTPQIFASWFCHLDDEQQADVFIAIAKEAESFPNYQGYQWYLVGRHLKTCACSTTEARNMIEELNNGLTSEDTN